MLVKKGEANRMESVLEIDRNVPRKPRAVRGVKGHNIK